MAHSRSTHRPELLGFAADHNTGAFLPMRVRNPLG
ncbi:hypothetical protein SacmaDRAFT_3962 [Saccharomonospora marina XMU15]|uniref:Uncharacterized protein n=1 Tax=Saccharomonospora marina XMU15 TaxID=882083 RepID=H5X3U1_9PSEU|nr:hypothetical protein SacmaDRAFT_3962 [Saccharomonospora marina XMU15]